MARISARRSLILALLVIAIIAGGLSIQYFSAPTEAGGATNTAKTTSTNLTTQSIASNPFTTTYTKSQNNSTSSSQLILNATDTIQYPFDSNFYLDEAYFPPTNEIWLYDYISSTLYFLNATTNQFLPQNVTFNSCPLGFTLGGMVYDSASHDMLVEADCPFRIIAFDANGKNVSTTVLSNSVYSATLFFQYDQANNKEYVSFQGANYFLALNSTNQVVSNVTLSKSGGEFGGMAYNPSNHYLYVSDSNSSSVYVYASNNTRVANLTLNYDLANALYDPANRLVYVASFSGGLWVLNGTTVLGSFDLNVSLYDNPVFDPANSELYVPTSNAGTVVISSQNVIETTLYIPLDYELNAVYDPAHGWMMYPNGGNITLIGTNNQQYATIVTGGPFFFGFFEASGVFDPINGLVYFLTSSEMVVV